MIKKVVKARERDEVGGKQGVDNAIDCMAPYRRF